MIDFDYWMNLYKSDERMFEKERRALLSNEIAKCDPKIKLKMQSIQAKVNLIRAKNGNNNINSCILVADMMWVSFSKLNEMFNEDK